MTLVQEIRQCIEEQLCKSRDKFIIYPFGEIGLQVKLILKEVYNIEDMYILDNNLSRYNQEIKPLSFLNNMSCDNYVLILASKNFEIYNELRENVKIFFDEERIVELPSMKFTGRAKANTRVGKYSYGPLCKHWLVESVGAFCSFAKGCDAVENHAMDYITTHPFIYYSNEYNNALPQVYNEYKDRKWYFDGVEPMGKARKLQKVVIGNDVWLGKNVIITNGANIGNGVIAGAGAIITKDVPDYAVVVGVPAKIIRYRYSQEQIRALNKIQWWNWSDEEIRERYQDFYLPVDQFIEKWL